MPPSLSNHEQKNGPCRRFRIATYFGFLFIRLYIIRPIKELADASTEFSLGNYGHR